MAPLLEANLLPKSENQNQSQKAKSEPKATDSSLPKSSFEEPKKVIQKASEPIQKVSHGSQFSIKAALEKKEEVVKDVLSEIKDENLPSDHFSQTELDQAWDLFLKNLSKTNTFAYNAISSFKLQKDDENKVVVRYSSETAKSEFDRLSGEFFNHFKRKVNNFKIEVDYTMDMTIKKEIMTKRKIFEKFAEINPLLKDLDDLMKFDLT